MTQIIEPNENSDLKQDIIRRWRSQVFTGILSGFDVTNGASGFQVTIASGIASINKTDVDDDETRINLDLSIADTGNDEHWSIFGSHTPGGSFPPPPMAIAAVKGTSGPDPAPPAQPSDSFKLADIFVPSGATGIGDCRIVNAPKLPDRGVNDADVIVERLLSSNMNVLFGGGGSFVYDSGANTLTWSDAIDLVATTITNKEKFQSVPFASIQIPAGAIGPLEAAPYDKTIGDNTVLFAVFERIAPNDPSSPLIQANGLRVLNLDAPDATEAAAFYDPIREKIVFIGAILGGSIKMRSGFGNPLPPPVADSPAQFLRNKSDGAHFWSPITEDLIVNILTITALSVTSGDPVEVGTIVNSPTLSGTVANHGGDGPTVAVLTNNDNGESKDVSGGWGGATQGFNSDQSYQEGDASNNGGVIFTLTADDGDTPAVRNTTLDWYRRHYHGVSANLTPDLSDDLFMKQALDQSAGPGLNAIANGDNPLRPGRGITIDQNPVSEYMYFCYPTRHGPVSQIIDNNTTFIVTGAYTLHGTITLVDTENGDAVITETYNVYRSNSLQNGNVNITVS
jgi:hypothetical protein